MWLFILILFLLCLSIMSWPFRLAVLFPLPFVGYFLVANLFNLNIDWVLPYLTEIVAPLKFLFHDPARFLYTVIPAYFALFAIGVILGLMRKFSSSFEMYRQRRFALLKFLFKWCVIYLAFVQCLRFVVSLAVSDPDVVFWSTKTIAPYVFAFFLFHWWNYMRKRTVDAEP